MDQDTMEDVVPSACEAELQNLMYHIDQMIQAKRAEWERDLQLIEARLSSKERECGLLAKDLEARTSELQQLRSRLDDSNRNSAEQVESLRTELTSLAKQHERVSRKYRRQEVQLQKEATAAKAQLQAEVADLTQKLAAAVADKQKMHWELADAKSQRDATAEKLRLLHEQSSGYADQLQKRKRISESVELSLQKNVDHLEQQLAKVKEQLAGYAASLTSVKSALADTTASCRTLADEKELLEADLRAAKKAAQAMQVDNSRLAMELRAAKHQLQQQQQQHNQHLSAAGGAERRARGCQTELSIGDIAYTEQELQQCRSRLGELAQRERRLADELDSARSESEREIARLKRLHRELAEELERARDNSDKQLKHGHAQIEQQRETMAKLEARLAGVSAEQVNSGERLATAERRLNSALEEAERTKVELSVANAQLEALRIENGKLRDSVANASSAQAMQLQRAQEAWSVERQALQARLADADSRARQAEAETAMFSNFTEEIEDGLDTQRVVRLIDGHVADLKRQTDLLLGGAVPS